MSLRHLPKIELHTHLEGAAPPAFIRDLAREKNIDLRGIFDDDGNYVFRDFDHFLKVYEAACEPLQTPEDFYRLTLAVLDEMASHNVIYAETFVSPDFCGGGDVAIWREYLAAMAQAAADRAGTIELRAIVTAIRHAGPEQARRTALCAAETAGDFLTGFGLAGAEMMHRPADFAYSFDMAREAGLRLTAHAGEWGGPDMVAETLDALRVERVGHGINARYNAALMDRLAAEEITLEICPISNIVLQAIPATKVHPFDQIRRAGVPVTVSTDDPPFFHTTMSTEFEYLSEAFGYNETDFADLNRAALDAAFCDAATKDRLAKRLETS